MATEEGSQMEKLSRDRDWAELHPDVLLKIFEKIGTLEVLRAAGCVCRSWRKVATEEPQLWRRIDITDHGYEDDASILVYPTRLAIDRSNGQLEEFAVQDFGDDALLQYLCDRTSVLRKLRLISCHLANEEAIAETARRQPLLEEIDITFGSFEDEATEMIGRECPQLKTFKFNDQWSSRPFLDNDYDYDYVGLPSDDDEALGIAKTMHQLRHLQLISNSMSNRGLRAILDGCPHLETLDIRQCRNVLMDADMLTLCARLKTIRLPEDSMDDYEFEADGDW